MDNLELKHIVPYLPYGLKVKYDRPNGLIDNITSLYDIQNEDDLKIRIGYSDAEHIWMFKPILRPMYDLKDKQIKELLKIYPNTDNFQYILKYAKDYQFKNLSASFVEYCIMEKLIEWKYDVFGLIDKGLAIDVNDIKS